MQIRRDGRDDRGYNGLVECGNKEAELEGECVRRGDPSREYGTYGESDEDGKDPESSSVRFVIFFNRCCRCCRNSGASLHELNALWDVAAHAALCRFRDWHFIHGGFVGRIVRSGIDTILPRELRRLRPRHLGGDRREAQLMICLQRLVNTRAKDEIRMLHSSQRGDFDLINGSYSRCFQHVAVSNSAVQTHRLATF
jgi:hypothetical protein